MDLIVVTQQVYRDASTLERRDALDQQWTVFLERIKGIPLLIPNCLNNLKRILDNSKSKGIVLTGGNDLTILKTNNIALERDKIERRLIRYGIDHEIPIIGVCRGMQMIAHFFGIKLRKIKGHVRKKHPLKLNKNSKFYPSFKKIDKVNSYHNYGFLVDEAKSEFEVFASYQETAEGIKHKKHNIVGIMWHPEREKPFEKEDLKFFKDFFKL